MLGLNVESLLQQVEHCDAFRTVGSLRSAQGVISANLNAEIGEVCEICTSETEHVLAEAIGFRDGYTQLLPFQRCDRLRSGLPVYGTGRRMLVPTGRELLGRVINGLGEPIDGKGPLGSRVRVPVQADSPAAMRRPRISQQLVTGLRVLDSLIPFGRGQRMALMAGSGVGKSTLLGEIAKGSDADVNVVALIGERGREVRPFIDDCLGEKGLARSVVVVATADEQPLMRIQATHAALAIAKSFRSAGQDVLLMLDSITRFATSQRELGLLLGEPPMNRGYTPGTFQAIASLLEQLGTSGEGSVSSLITVLVEGDDFNEPISDSVRSVVDGHIVLDRSLAEHAHFPAVHVGQSLSRVSRDITETAHQKAASRVRDALATYAEFEDLIRVGAYTSGSSSQIDKAIHLKSAIDDFVKQDVGVRAELTETTRRLRQLADQWSNE